MKTSASSPVLLSAEHLCLGYAGHRVLSDVTLSVHRGELWVLLGANGQGKTSFLHAVLGLLAPLSGTLTLDPNGAQRQHIGFVPQRCDLNPTLPTTVREFVSLGLVGIPVTASARRERLAAALAHVGLGALAARNYWALSGGQRQRALVARALIREPQILILDEPTTGLDPTAQDALLHLLVSWNRERALTILYVTHDLSIAEDYATHAALFAAGSVVAGPRDAVLTSTHLERIYGPPQRQPHLQRSAGGVL
jgi:ABC-type Mn2+/Zn2+ transport system ATPase subunit